MHFSTLFSLAAAGALVASMPYNGANQIVDNQGPGVLSADTKGPQYWAKEEKLLYDLLIKYRKEANVPNPEIPRSPSLNMVAQTHVANPFFEKSGSNCNPHSWPEAAEKKTNWKSCCFDLSQPEAHPCMWNKPREITEKKYKGDGFEVYYGGDPKVYTSSDTAEECLQALQKSPHHNDVLINNATWTMKWEAVGVGMAKGQCAIWFGLEKDTATLPDSQTAQDGLEIPDAQEQQVVPEIPDAQEQQVVPEIPDAQEQQVVPEIPDAQEQQVGPETPDAREQQDGLETPDAQEQQDGLEIPDSLEQQVVPEIPDAQEQQVGHEKPNNPNPNCNPTPTPTPDAEPTPDNDSRVATIWTQCGGKTWTGPTVCAEGLVCKNFGVWYSQCKPAA